MSNLTIPVVADPFNTPLAVNPNGDPPNFEGGPTLQPAVLATGVMFIPISMIIVTIRLVMSLRSSKRFHCDDSTANEEVALSQICASPEKYVESLIGLYSTNVNFLLFVMANTFKHPWDVPVSIVTPELLKAHAAAQTLNGVAHAFIKASIPTLFIRLFGTLRWLRITSYCLIGVAILANLIPALSLLVVCTSTSFEDWDLFLLHTCSASTEPQSTVSSVFSVAFDITVVAIPTFITSRLNLGREKKLGLMVVFLFGLLVVAASIAGLGYRIALQIDMSDYLWTDTNIAITS
ncbi:hypothetical protein GGS26DRAFT_593684 [Hypomontagnella submonticulosa]|nr:hypothetical protein GGS26DRAFT_593684 [Hypomontagnella submonticulosa]